MTYIPGDYWMACDRCGRRYRKSVMKKTWNNLWVCPEDFEERHPQEYVRGVQDTITVPVSRPWGPSNLLSQSIIDPSGIDNSSVYNDPPVSELYEPSITDPDDITNPKYGA